MMISRHVRETRSQKHFQNWFSEVVCDWLFSFKNENRAAGLAITLAAARVRAATGQVAEAMKDLASILRDAKRYGYGGYQLEATLELGELELESGSRAARDHLAALEREAKTKGFGLIGHKAASALKAEVKQPR